jgi:hypothetical protein
MAAMLYAMADREKRKTENGLALQCRTAALVSGGVEQVRFRNKPEER